MIIVAVAAGAGALSALTFIAGFLYCSISGGR